MSLLSCSFHQLIWRHLCSFPTLLVKLRITFKAGHLQALQWQLCYFDAACCTSLTLLVHPTATLSDYHSSSHCRHSAAAQLSFCPRLVLLPGFLPLLSPDHQSCCWAPPAVAVLVPASKCWCYTCCLISSLIDEVRHIWPTCWEHKLVLKGLWRTAGGTRGFAAGHKHKHRHTNSSYHRQLPCQL